MLRLFQYIFQQTGLSNACLAQYHQTDASLFTSEAVNGTGKQIPLLLTSKENLPRFRRGLHCAALGNKLGHPLVAQILNLLHEQCGLLTGILKEFLRKQLFQLLIQHRSFGVLPLHPVNLHQTAVRRLVVFIQLQQLQTAALTPVPPLLLKALFHILFQPLQIDPVVPLPDCNNPFVIVLIVF